MVWHDDNNRSVGDKEKSAWEAQWDKKLQEWWQAGDKMLKNIRHRFSPLRLFGAAAAVVSLIWLLSGVYIVDQGNRGVVTRFGAYRETTMPGPHWHLPQPIEDVAVVNIEKQRFIEVGYRSAATSLKSASVLPEALMLTKDENIISLRLAVQYQIKSAKDYLFNVKDNESTLKQITESVQRSVIGRNDMDFILTEGRSQIVSDIKEEIQLALDLFATGLRVTSVNLQDAQPPEEVQAAFEDAIRAREDKQRLINEAQAYANEIIPKARGAAARIVQEAEAYEAQLVARAQGESERFEQLLTEYEKAPGITRKRMYLESKEKFFSQTNKVLVNTDNGNNMFYMPLNSLNPAAAANGRSAVTESAASAETANSPQSTSARRITTIRSSRSK